MTMRRSFRISMIAAAAMLSLGALTLPSQGQSGARPVYTADGKMLQLPAGFETWVFVGSNLGLSYLDEMTRNDSREANRAQDRQFFHNVYISPEAYAHFAATKEFPDPTILVMEVFVSEDRDPRGVLKSGVYNGEQVGLEVAVKDTHRPAGHLAPPAASPWAYYVFKDPFQPPPVLRQAAAPDQTGFCQRCHKANAPPDNVWVRFYPALRKFMP
ncbi:MAG: cytochrome P460 family protein [Alphaproteobacteria bacterium]